MKSTEFKTENDKEQNRQTDVVLLEWMGKMTGTGGWGGRGRVCAPRSKNKKEE